MRVSDPRRNALRFIPTPHETACKHVPRGAAETPTRSLRTASARSKLSSRLFRGALAVVAILGAAIATPARAEVKQATADTFLIVFTQQLQAKPAKVYDAVVKIQQWWSGEHTYSGNAANLSLLAEAGGCFCERWKDGSVEHGTVIFAMRDQVLRVRTALGPLQSKAVTGILTFQMKPDGEGTMLTVGYRVNGTAESALDKDAPNVDAVLGLQFARLTRLILTGTAEGT
jgi:uncharacterized protein YndB with AHSA1/START domain